MFTVLKILQSIEDYTFENPFFAVELKNLASNELSRVKFLRQKINERTSWALVLAAFIDVFGNDYCPQSFLLEDSSLLKLPTTK